MRAFGLDETPIIMAGGVWWLEEWEDWIDNPDLGPDRLPVRHPPAADPGEPDRRGLEAEAADASRKGDVFLNRFSPTGFYSIGREQRLHPGAARAQRAPGRLHDRAGGRAHGRVRRRPAQARSSISRRTTSSACRRWEAEGYHRGAAHAGHHAGLRHAARRPREITADQVACMGCLSQCRFSNWSQHEPGLQQRQEGRPAQLLHPEDAAGRSAMTADEPQQVEHNLMFSGHNAFRFALRPVLLERLHPDRAAARGTHIDGPLTG